MCTIIIVKHLAVQMNVSGGYDLAVLVLFVLCYVLIAVLSRF